VREVLSVMQETSVNPVAVRRHSKAVASTWEHVFATIFGNQLCSVMGNDQGNGFPVSVTPSKKLAQDITGQEFKVTVCHEFINATGLFPCLQGKFQVYPFNDNIRIRLKGVSELISLYLTATAYLKEEYPGWATSFKWPMEYLR